MEFHRQAGIILPSELPAVTIIGCGGIGSPTAIICAKMGVPILSLIDDDTVESHNLPNQFYLLNDLGKQKCQALADNVKKISITTAAGYFQRIKAEDFLSGVVVSGVDTMSARYDIWSAVQKHKEDIPLYLEARMLKEVGIIHTLFPNKMTPEDVKWYEDTLCSDEDAVDGPCTERAVAYNVFAIGSFIACQIKKFAKGEDMKRQIIIDLANTLMMT